MKPKLTKDLMEFYKKRLKSSKSISERLIFMWSLFTSLFLLFTYLNYSIFHLDNVIIGFFHELLIIPCILIQPVFLFFALKRFYMKKYITKTYGCLAVVILSVSQIFVWSSILLFRF